MDIILFVCVLERNIYFKQHILKPGNKSVVKNHKELFSVLCLQLLTKANLCIVVVRDIWKSM